MRRTDLSLGGFELVRGADYGNGDVLEELFRSNGGPNYIGGFIFAPMLRMAHRANCYLIYPGTLRLATGMNRVTTMLVVN